AACVEARQPFVIDNTNVTAAARAQFITPAKAAGFHVTGYYFRSDVKAALLRNSLRQGAARVPDKALLGTYKRLELPGRGEGFDALFYVRAGGAGEFLVEEWADEI
ncbi:MAG TPA: AAA family ATPase, partial [Pyrinomonadaceae bacterium]|nr:AAA family ATPase [Pyrinomonadaceae bacterium]